MLDPEKGCHKTHLHYAGLLSKLTFTMTEDSSLDLGWTKISFCKSIRYDLLGTVLQITICIDMPVP